MTRIACWLLTGLLLGGITVPRAELVEEIVAIVNGDIITTSQLEEEEQARVADAYRRYTGEELDQRVEEIKGDVLNQMIDRKILYHYAQRIYDTNRMADVFYESFREQQMKTQGMDEAEFERMLAAEGFTVEEMRQRLVEAFAPDEVIRAEVSGRVSVGDAECRAYYDENQQEFMRPGEVTLREIVIMAESEEDKQLRRARAQEVLQRLQAGEDFATLAGEVSETGTKDSGGLLGPLKVGDISEQLEAVAFNAPLGEVSEVLEMPYGFHIVKVEERRETGVAPYDEIAEELREALVSRKTYEELRVFLKKARNEAEWCVRPAYRERVTGEVAESICKPL
jgi:peptidyl-prolyl cis-trans isomerase C